MCVQLYVPQVPGLLQEYERSPNQAHLNYRDLWLETKDGKKLHGWLMWKHCRGFEEVKQLPAIVFFQANAGNISHRLPFFYSMIRSLDCAIIAISYRGYGPSEGSPNEAGLKLDAETVMEFCTSCEDLDVSRIFIFGRSLGGAVAMDLVSRHQNKFAGLIVENTFTSIAEMVRCLFPFLRPVVALPPLAYFLIRNKWNNKEAVKRVDKVPVLFLASGKDEMVPPQQMATLHQLCPSPHTTFEEFPDASHMNAYDEYPVAYWAAIRHFMDSSSPS